MPTNKSLGQHWLSDRSILSSIVDLAELSSNDHVLEIGPGLGTLTSVLLKQAEGVTAVEFDPELARKLPGQFPGKNLRVVNEDILKFNLSQLPKNYAVVANVPYYITAKIIQVLLASSNRPSRIVLLVQKEVAQRLAAGPGDMSVLAISAQIQAHVTLGPVVPAEFFDPAPKVDSQVVVMQLRPIPLIDHALEHIFFQVVKAGFSAKRKKIRSSLSGGLGIDRDLVETFLTEAHVSPDTRAENLSLAEWIDLARIVGTWQVADTVEFQKLSKDSTS